MLEGKFVDFKLGLVSKYKDLQLQFILYWVFYSNQSKICTVFGS
jgi:hypothetical protein